MKINLLAIASVLFLMTGAAHHAQALSVGNSEFANSDGTSKFSDPDEQQNLPSAGGQQTILPLPDGSSMMFGGVTHTVKPSAPATSCTGSGTDCACPNCAAKE